MAPYTCSIRVIIENLTRNYFSFSSFLSIGIKVYTIFPIFVVSNPMRTWFCCCVRGHPFRTSGLPGGGGVLKNRTSIVISQGILLLNPDRRGRGGLKIPIFAGRPKWMAPYDIFKNFKGISVAAKSDNFENRWPTKLG